MKTFVTRTLTATIFAAIMLVGILWNEISFFLLFSLISIFTQMEYIRISRKLDYRYSRVSPLYPISLLIANCGIVIFYSGKLIHIGSIYLSTAGPWIVLAALLSLIFTEWQSSQPGKLIRAGLSFFGLSYISLSAAMMVDLRMEKPYPGFALIPLAIILMIWINDTMAYLVGSLIGKTPFFPTISPKKTWEGTLGGALLTITCASLFGWLEKYYTLKDWVILGIIVAVLGTIGDLFESRLKRMAGIKDSGSVMPGHGGFLDRFDSLLFVIPFAWMYVRLFMWR
ncbi:MAG TPA: phosphatidate cytidylyltransferase [Chitinophagaceae bacterium]|nr:phosphatidate cytidylyltransferase [Chitinophagaceae bacterium]